ncbi:uncharacterized protein LOC129236079 [Anastrepha obliqua]|uniref:uncharacterized protein LOC129236079 n=1 Tax=Anastrepha obliqua TaxID=95512 RepID=UPI002409F4B0|nr:uncharacterized protein LOC129236079 [Anastrepha obliqua]
MDVIIDHILHFLQFDVPSIFEKERCLENVYEPHPHITKGDEMMECDEDEDFDDPDNQLGDFCEELKQMEIEENECCSKSKQSQVRRSERAAESECLLDDVKDEAPCEENNADPMAGGDKCPCEAVCKRVVSKITDKCSSSTLLELHCIEERAVKLWETLHSHMRNNNCGKLPNWWDLKSWQKLPFYWAAVSNEILCDDPFENFKQFYIGNKKSSKRIAKHQLDRTLVMWHRLSGKQRLPFVMEAFISKVGAGKVNIADEHEIHRIIRDLQNK